MLDVLRRDASNDRMINHVHTYINMYASLFDRWAWEEPSLRAASLSHTPTIFYENGSPALAAQVSKQCYLIYIIAQRIYLMIRTHDLLDVADWIAQGF
jgi:hypothetical protein